MISPKVLVTTTSSLDGWDIHSYLGPVFSHIVAGTGYFSDFAASFSDIFGGRSHSYQKQLSAINTEAIELLKSKAVRLGGNLVLGFKIDHDEISGKAKQMFMVTASGTVARGVQRTTETGIENKSAILSADDLEDALRKKTIVEQCESDNVFLTEDDWNFATANQVLEIAPAILASLQQSLMQGTAQENLNIEARRRYFLALPPSGSIASLYGSLETCDLLFPFVHDTVFEGDLFDFEAIQGLLASSKFKVQKWALSLAMANKTFYTPEDIARFGNLVSTIRSAFAVRAKFIEEKSKLTSSVKSKWRCECGVKNNKEERRCTACGRDTYGFLRYEPTPEKVIKSIQRKVDIINESFEHR